ncbi:MAG: hypothetical protein ABI779_00145 [Acidobacteriota bacterium]
MDTRIVRRWVQLGAVGAVLLAAEVALGGEGFGMLRKRANLARIHPPQVNIGSSTIFVKTNSQANKYATAAERMQNLLESELLGSDPTLRLESRNPEVAIDVTILQSDYSEKWEEKTGMRNVQTGNDEKGRPVFQARQMQIRFKVVKHLFSVSFKVRDTKKGATLAADTIRKNFQAEYEDGNGAPEAASIEESDVAAVVDDLTRRLTPTREIIGVLVPRGSLDNAVPFAEAGMWSKYLEMLEKAPKIVNPVQDSYRQYALGIAYEALGYGADDLDTALKYLEQASAYYNGAAEANPKETYFILNSKSQPSLFGRARSAAATVLPGVVTKPVDTKEVSSTLLAPLARVQSALVQYQKMKELASAAPTLQARAPARNGGSAGGSKDLDAAPATDALTNEGVVDMLRAGLPESVILTSINSAKKTAFDVSPRGLIQLSEARASTALLERIQAVAGKKSSASSSKPKSKKSS